MTAGPREGPDLGSIPKGDSPPPEHQGQVPVIEADIWPLMAQVCGLNETETRETPSRAQAGAPLVQVYSSINTEEALRELSRLKDYGAFLLPIEDDDGKTFCTIALGPFPTEESARQYAGGLRSSGIAPKAEVAYFPSFTQ